jgi:hypothetical protein
MPFLLPALVLIMKVLTHWQGQCEDRRNMRERVLSNPQDDANGSERLRKLTCDRFVDAPLVDFCDVGVLLLVTVLAPGGDANWHDVPVEKPIKMTSEHNEAHSPGAP